MNADMSIDKQHGILPGRIRSVLKVGLAAASLFLLWGAPAVVVGQAAQAGQEEELSLTLEDALQMAQENNTQNQLADEDIKEVRSQYRETNALFLPQVSLEETAISTNNPLNVFGSLLKQEVVTTADFNPVTLNDPDRTENYTTSINVRQPLLNPSGFLGRAALKKQLDATRLKKDRTKEYVDFRVKQTWYQLVLARRRTGIIDTALTAAKANLEQAKDFFKQGMVNRADLLSAEVRVRQLQSDRSQARNARDNTQRQLAYLLGIDKEVVIRPDGGLVMPRVQELEADYSPVIRDRSDMRALEYQIDASKKKLSSMKFNFVPTVNLFGSYEWNDDVLLGTGAQNYTVGATLRWDLFKGFKNVSSIQQSQVQLSKAKLQYHDQLRQNRVEVASELNSLQTSREQVEIAQTTVEQAKESYRIRHNRYEQGMERMSDLLSAEATLSQSKLQLASALFNYNVQVAKLELLLEKNLAD
jgi:outer membrane protein TolC